MAIEQSRKSFRVAPNTKIGGSGPVSVVFRQKTNGAAEVSLGLDYSKASPPDLSYVADNVSVIESRSGFSIKFGKLDSGEVSLKTRIDILFPKSMFQNQLIQSSRNFLTDLPLSPEPTPASPKLQDPEKTQTFRANNVMLGAWGDEGVADFYYISPGDFAFAARGQLSDIRLVPAVRVTMDVLLLREFLTQCHQFDTSGDMSDSVAPEEN
jgi:hypothetical protein